MENLTGWKMSPRVKCMLNEKNILKENILEWKFTFPRKLHWSKNIPEEQFIGWNYFMK